MSAPPLTRLVAPPEEAHAIRANVRCADPLTLGPNYRMARLEHAAGLTELLADPRVSDPIYDLPRPITLRNISDWIAEAQRKRTDGEGLLVVMLDYGGEVCGYSCFTVWPERSAAEIAGGYRADRQHQGEGKRGAARSFDWMFDAFGVRLIAVTAALDNPRSARVIETAGFRYMGTRVCTRADGTARESRYWEMHRPRA
jgi:RimJ/RimL family protein N-acetyltransferase